MFVTALFIYLLATTSLQLNFALLAGAVIVDVFTIGGTASVLESWITGKRSIETWDD